MLSRNPTRYLVDFHEAHLFDDTDNRIHQSHRDICSGVVMDTFFTIFLDIQHIYLKIYYGGFSFFLQYPCFFRMFSSNFENETS